MAEKHRKRNKLIHIKLSEDEHEYFEKKVKACNLSMSEYVRRIIFDGVIINYEAFTNDDIKELQKSLQKVGVNINQIARHINENGGKYDRQDIDDLLTEFSELQQSFYAKIYNLK